ncbi:MAG: hypothetical protein M1524_02815 [Patescibacteria group bacterium]|nr:hypothetical protein [Patescibacteria group bacterium]
MSFLREVGQRLGLVISEDEKRLRKELQARSSDVLVSSQVSPYINFMAENVSRANIHNRVDGESGIVETIVDGKLEGKKVVFRASASTNFFPGEEYSYKSSLTLSCSTRPRGALQDIVSSEELAEVEFSDGSGKVITWTDPEFVARAVTHVFVVLGFKTHWEDPILFADKLQKFYDSFHKKDKIIS